nr:flagellin [Lachnospiraceae bacterium]
NITSGDYTGTYTKTTVTQTVTNTDGTVDETVTVTETYNLTTQDSTGTYTGETVTTTVTTDKGGDSESVEETITKSGSFTQTNLSIDITNLGAMRLQVGANETQVIDVRIPKVSLETLGIDDMDIRTEDTATEAITKISDAIDYISAERSRLGAYQNRLESNIANLDVSTENMTSAYSRIMDVDMAEEMTQYSTYQVLSQTSTSMLAQANERPSQVLQILQ